MAWIDCCQAAVSKLDWLHAASREAVGVRSHLRFCCGTIVDFIPLVWILSVNVPSDWLLGTAAWQPPYKGLYHSVSIATRLSKSVCELRPGCTWPIPSPSPRHLCTSCCNERLLYVNLLNIFLHVKFPYSGQWLVYLYSSHIQSCRTSRCNINTR